MPAYHQLRRRLAKAISEGLLPVGTQLPGEHDLARFTGVGRPTIRQALAGLRDAGLISIERGRGTFVSAPHPRLTLLGFDGVTAMLERSGISAKTETRGVHVHPEAVFTVLGTMPGPVVVVERTRALPGGDVFVVEEDILSLERYPGVQDRLRQQLSVAALLTDVYGVTIAWSRVATRAVPAGRSLGRLLGVRAGTPLVEMERWNFDARCELLHAARFTIQTDVLPLVEEVVNRGS